MALHCHMKQKDCTRTGVSPRVTMPSPAHPPAHSIGLKLTVTIKSDTASHHKCKTCSSSKLTAAKWYDRAQSHKLPKKVIHRVQGWGQLAGTPEGGLGCSQSRAAASPRGGGCVQVFQAELVDKHIKTHTGANGGISDLKGMGATVRMTCVSPAPRPLCT